MASDDGEVVVQARQEPWFGSSRVSVNTAIAMNVAGDTVGVYMGRNSPLVINGDSISATNTPVSLPNGGLVFAPNKTSSFFIVQWPSGFVSSIRNGGRYINVGMSAPEGTTTSYQGLLGNMDGEYNNDFITREGVDLGNSVTYDELYNVFGDSWRIIPEESLFDYLPGTNTETFQLMDFPFRPIRFNDLDAEARERARMVCEAAGITNPQILEDCILDIVVTGDESFADGAADTVEPEEELDVEFPIFFDDWTAEASGDGTNWSVDASGRSVRQLVNGAPTLICEPAGIH